MFTSAEVWFYQSLAGIQIHPSARGFDRVLIKPKPVAGPPSLVLHIANVSSSYSFFFSDLSFVNASLVTVRGVIAVQWSLDAESHALVLNITIPPNMQATVYPPGQQAHVFSPSNAQSAIPAVELGSGRHSFSSFFFT